MLCDLWNSFLFSKEQDDGSEAFSIGYKFWCKETSLETPAKQNELVKAFDNRPH